jgi:hypothetical protein
VKIELRQKKAFNTIDQRVFAGLPRGKPTTLGRQWIDADEAGNPIAGNPSAGKRLLLPILRNRRRDLAI